jgi:DNA-binding transcriptional ArsR family regulator
MLERPAANPTLTADVQAYLHETLGVDVRIRRWAGAQKLPYFLQDSFDLHELQLRDKQILLASGRKERLPALGTLRTQLDKLVSIAERPVVFATITLASYERKRLVEQKVPFVVPGNQLYLPDLGIDFREYFRQPLAAVMAFTPATQAIFIAALLREEWKDELKPAEILAQLGYTTMTLSRAVRELAAAGLVTASQDGRVRSMRVNHPPAQAWEQAGPFLRNPVKRVLWVDYWGGPKSLRPPLAGLSALASHSMLAEPAHPIYAITPAEWKMVQGTKVRELPAPQPHASQWQVWSYTPSLMKPDVTVDPLSLTLSLKDEKDDRVQQALDELRGQFPW